VLAHRLLCSAETSRHRVATAMREKRMKDTHAMDIIYALTVAGFFAVAIAYVRFCDRA
jgi:hypothetical protein